MVQQSLVPNQMPEKTENYYLVEMAQVMVAVVAVATTAAEAVAALEPYQQTKPEAEAAVHHY